MGMVQMRLDVVGVAFCHVIGHIWHVHNTTLCRSLDSPHNHSNLGLTNQRREVSRRHKILSSHWSIQNRTLVVTVK